MRGITLWGYIQGQTWRANTHLVSSGNTDAVERPAMQWLKQYLNQPVVTPPTYKNTYNHPANTDDVNDDGSVTIIDALIIARYSVGLNSPDFIVNRTDVNCDGNITIIDALIVAQYYVGFVTKSTLDLYCLNIAFASM